MTFLFFRLLLYFILTMIFLKVIFLAKINLTILTTVVTCSLQCSPKLASLITIISSFIDS